MKPELGVVEQHRERIIRAMSLEKALSGPLIAIIGPCSNQIENNDTIVSEGLQVASIGTGSIIGVHRIPFWKPRTPKPGAIKRPWEGIIDTDINTALELTAHEAYDLGIPIAAELGKPEHIGLFSPMLSFAWLGSRSVEDDLLDLSIAGLRGPVSVGVKNGMEGRPDSALARMGRLGALGVENQIMIFRGGENARTPEGWENAFKRAHFLTGGRMIVDVAHGGEMAFDPSGSFSKTQQGQENCLRRVIELAEEGLFTRGVMIEASDVVIPNPEHRTDINMDFDKAISGVLRLAGVRNKTKDTRERIAESNYLNRAAGI